jgi:hypothetical protein
MMVMMMIIITIIIIIITVKPEQRTWNARQGTTENSQIGHCTHRAESAYVQVQNV